MPWALAITLAECCVGTGLGVRTQLPSVASAIGFGDIATLFGESASRVVLSVAAGREAELISLAAREHLPAHRLGVVTGKRVQMAIDGGTVIDEPLAEVERTWGTAIGRYFEPANAIA